MSKKLPTTDGKNINRLPTWADIINICFQKKDGLRERISFFCCWYRYIATANIKITKSHLKDATDFINFIEKSKVEKPNVFCLDESSKKILSRLM